MDVRIYSRYQKASYPGGIGVINVSRRLDWWLGFHLPEPSLEIASSESWGFTPHLDANVLSTNKLKSCHGGYIIRNGTYAIGKM